MEKMKRAGAIKDIRSFILPPPAKRLPLLNVSLTDKSGEDHGLSSSNAVASNSTIAAARASASGAEVDEY